MGIEPVGEGAVLLADRLDPLGILDRGLDLEPVADDPGIGEQASPLPRAVARDLGDLEVVVGAAERLALLQDGEPGQARLVDLQHQPLEQPASSR